MNSDNILPSRSQSSTPAVSPPVHPVEEFSRADNDYLGSQPVPNTQEEIKHELERFFAATEMEIGWLNVFPKTEQADKFLNQQERICASRLFRWITKAVRQRNRRFFHDLAGALHRAKFNAPTTKTSRELIQAASALSREKGIEPTQAEVIKQWETRTGRSKSEMNVKRELRAAKLKLPKDEPGGKPGRRAARRFIS
jgi:hypothetical protein